MSTLLYLFRPGSQMTGPPLIMDGWQGCDTDTTQHVIGLWAVLRLRFVAQTQDLNLQAHLHQFQQFLCLQLLHSLAILQGLRSYVPNG